MLIKSLEILRDFKGAKPNSQPLRYPFLPYRLRKDALMLEIWLAQNPRDLISTSLKAY